MTPAYRRLRGYAFDPSFSSTIDRRQSNEVIYRVRWEDTTIGPAGEYIEVVDYDPTKNDYYTPVDLEDRLVLADYGLPLSESDPKFHQQQVYAVVMSVIAQFEKALTRKIIWSRIVDKDDSGRTEFINQFVRRLRIYPHAMRQQNAYYSPAKLALLFGYFQASDQWLGNNIPGAAIFTCLSPDIVAHETTHAILDSLHPYLRKDTNPDMLAFHEGFADIIALLQRFTFRTVVEDQIRNAKGDLLSPHSFLGDLAMQFGQAVSTNRQALRSFLVDRDAQGNITPIKPDPAKYRTTVEPHERGGLLVAAVFDAFVRLYRYKTADLIRLASDGSGILGQGEIDPDLVQRLSSEACSIAEKLSRVCIRALDYCPPVDLNFGDYLRALITADVEHNPEDEDGLRYALLESFRAWGLVPKDVNTYSVDSLMWKSPEEYYGKNSPYPATLKESLRYLFAPAEAGAEADADNTRVVQSMERVLRENDRGNIFKASGVLSAAVHDMFKEDFQMYSKGLEKLMGMNFETIEYEFFDETFKQQMKLTSIQRDVFQVHKCRPLIRYNNRDGYAYKILLITFLQKIWIDLKGTPYEEFFPDARFEFRGGATLIIDLANYEIKYCIVKNVSSALRLQTQLQYAMNRSSGEENAALLMQDAEPFAALHIH